MSTVGCRREAAPRCFLAAALLAWALGPALFPSGGRLARAEEGAGPGGGCEKLPRVGKIRLDRRQIFDVTKPELVEAPYTWVNALHFDTVDQVVLREMLLGEGDSLDEALLREIERNLRALAIVRDVWIEETPRECGIVDLTVHFQETWTLQPQLNLSGGGGVLKGSAGLYEGNLFGYGKNARIFYRKGIDRDSVDLAYKDPRLLGSRWDTVLAYADRTDGRRIVGDLQHPFFSLETRAAGGGSGSYEKDKARLFEGGEEIHSYERNEEAGSAWAGLRLGAAADRPVNRLLASYSFSRTTFGQDLLDPKGFGTPPPDRRFSTLWLGFQRIVPDYIVRDHLERFDRQEDLNLGNEVVAWAGFSPEAIGSTRDTWHLSVRDGLGFRWNDEHLLFLNGALSGRFGSAEVENAVQTALLRYYYTGLPRQTIFLQAFEQYGWNLDPEKQFLLGGGNGLRGYPARFLEGDKRILVSAEDRIFVWEHILDLVSLGLAVFFDSGAAAHEGSGFALDNFRSDVGAGLRIVVPASQIGDPIRVDFAWALNGNDDGGARWMISFGQGQAPDSITHEE